MSWRCVCLAVALLLPMASGCKDDAVPATETLAIPARAAPKIELQDPGQQPHAVLALHPTAGTTEAFTLTLGTRMSLVGGPAQVPSIPVPTTVTRLHADVEAVDQQGFVVRYAVDGVEVQPMDEALPAVLDKVRESLASLLHYRSRLRMDPRGHMRSGQVQFPRDSPAQVHAAMQQMTESLGQLSAPLPEPPVGVGARWTATTELRHGGMQLRQIGEYTLVSRDGDRARVEVTLRQELLDPKVTMPGMPGQARVSEFRSSGKGAFELDLARVTPQSLAMKSQLAATMELTVLGDSRPVKMELAIDLAMARDPG